MLQPISKMRNAKQEEAPRYADRVAVLLSEHSATAVSSAMPQSEGGGQESEGLTGESCGSEATVSLMPGIDSSGLTSTPTTDGDLDIQDRSDGQDFGEAGERLTQALQLVLAQIEGGAYHRVESVRTATATGLDRLSTEVRQVERQLTEVRVEVQSAVQRESETCSSLAALDKRSSQVESDLRAVQDGVLTLTDARSALEEQVQNLSNSLASVESRVTALVQAVEGFNKSLQSYGQAAGGVSAFCERVVESQASLNARQDEQALAIKQLAADAARRGSLIDSLISSLRGLDARKELRQNIDRDVKVVMIDGTEASIRGHVVDASDSGLGIQLDTPVRLGSQLRLDVGGAQLIGEVAYCRKQGALHRVGVKSVRLVEDQTEPQK